MVRESMVARTLCLLLLGITLLAIGLCQGTEQNDAKSVSKAKDEVLTVEEEANQAVMNRNSGTLDGLFADEMVWLTSRGEILTKAQVLENVRSGKQTSLWKKTDDRQLHVHGDTVVLYITMKPQVGSKDDSERMTTTVFVNESGRWKIVAHGETVAMQQ